VTGGWANPTARRGMESPFLADAFEGLTVCLLVHETPAIGIAFNEAIVLRIEHLGSVTDCSVSMPVTFWRICSHVFMLLF